MVIYTKILEKDTINKAYEVYYECKAAEDIIKNVLEGHIQIKNQEMYDQFYRDYVRNTVAYDHEIRTIEQEILGQDVVLPESTTYLSPIRGKLILLPVKAFDEGVEAYLERKGFKKVDIK